MKNIKDFLVRNGIWIVIGGLALWLLKPGLAEINTLLLISAVECVAMALSGVAVYVFTKIDFTKAEAMSSLGSIFLGVHICVGLIVLGVYIAQYGG